MKKWSVFLLLSAFCAVNICHGYNEDYWRNSENDYLEYISSKRRQIEDALLRDRSTRDLYPERSLKYFNRDDGDENDEDLPDNYQFHNEDDEEERSEKEDRERMRNLERTQNKRAERIERLKKESSDVDSPNHVIQNNHHHQSDAKAQKKKAKPKFVKLKKNPKTRSKKKDGIVSHENETVNLDKISKKKKDAISSHENEATSKEQPDDSKNKQKIDMERIHRDKIPKKDTVKESDAKFAVEENSITNDESKDSTKTAASKAPSSNRSAPSHAPLVAPPPKPVSNKKDTKKLDQALFIMVVAACSVAGVAGLILASYCWYRLRNQTDDAHDEEYKKKHTKKPMDKRSELTDDEKLVKGAEVYHYMHAKKQLAAMENSGTQKKAVDIAESDSSDEESDNTVYECPGLAPPGDMKVINPLFSDAEKDHSDARSDDSHVSSPTRDISPPQPHGKPGPSQQ